MGICFLQANLELGTIHKIHILEQVQSLHLNCKTYDIALLKPENLLDTGHGKQHAILKIKISNDSFKGQIITNYNDNLALFF